MGRAGDDPMVASRVAFGHNHAVFVDDLNPGPQERLFPGDVLVLMGQDEKLAETERALSS